MQVERLGQIIISAGLQTFYALAYRVACGQHQHRQLQPLAAPASKQVQAVFVGQPQVQYADVEMRGLDGRIRLGGTAPIDPETLQLQACLDPTGHQSVIFHQQHVHCVFLNLRSHRL